MQKKTTESLLRLSPEAFERTVKLPVVVVLDNLRSANNVGSFFRTCDAFAVQGLALCGITAAPPNREIHKTALGAELTVEWRYFGTTLEAVEQLCGEGFVPVAVEQVEGSVRLADFTPEEGVKYALIFGNEVAGVEQAVVDMCRTAVEIPQAGTKHSLNVAVSGGVMLWHMFAHYTKQD